VIQRQVLGAIAVLTGVVIAAKDFSSITGGTFQCRSGLPLVNRCDLDL
jgi:hypothetical protein